MGEEDIMGHGREKEREGERERERIFLEKNGVLAMKNPYFSKHSMVPK